MSDVFREVDEEVRRERATELWRRHGGVLLAVALVIVLVVGGWRLWDYWQDQRAAELGDRYAAAMTLAESGDAEGAQAAFNAIAAEGQGGYPILARLAAAAEQARAGDVEGAAAAYRAAAEEADGTMADLARLRAAYLMVGREDTDAIMAVLGDTADTGNAFYLSAQEVLGLEAWDRDDLEVANTHFLAIVSAPEPPAGLRSRAEIMLDLIAGSGGTPPDVEPLPSAEPSLTAPVETQTEPTDTLPLDTLSPDALPLGAERTQPAAPGDAPTSEAPVGETPADTTQSDIPTESETPQ